MSSTSSQNLPAFITSIDSPPRPGQPMDNMLDPEFAALVEDRLVWTAKHVKRCALTLSDGYNRVDKNGNLVGPFVVFIPYPDVDFEAYLCELIYYLPINVDGKMIASKSPRVALLSRPVLCNGALTVLDAYVVASALPCPFTKSDRVNRVQTNKWKIWSGLADGSLVDLPTCLGFNPSDFSPKKNDDKKAKTGLCALQSRFKFDSEFEDEAAMVNDLRDRIPRRVQRWSAMSQPIKLEHRKHLLETGERLSPRKQSPSDKKSHHSDDDKVSKKKHKKNKNKKNKKKADKEHKKSRKQRDSSPVRKNSQPKAKPVDVPARITEADLREALQRCDALSRQNAELIRQLESK